MNRLTGAGKRFSLLSAAVVFIDLIVITISTWLALSARQNLPWFTSDGQDLNQLLFPISAVVFVLWPLMIFVMGDTHRCTWGAAHQSTGACCKPLSTRPL